MTIKRIISNEIDFELAEKRLKANPAIEKIYKRKTFWMVQTVPLWIGDVNFGKFDIKIKFDKYGDNNFKPATILSLYCKKPIVKNQDDFVKKFGMFGIRQHILANAQSIVNNKNDHKKIQMSVVCKGTYYNYFFDANKYGDLAKAFFWIIAALLAEDDKEAFTTIESFKTSLSSVRSCLTEDETKICFGKDNQKKMNYDTFMKSLVEDKIKFKSKLTSPDLNNFIGVYKPKRDEGYCDDCGNYFDYLDDNGLCDYCAEKVNCVKCDSFEHPDDMYYFDKDDLYYCSDCWNDSIACVDCEKRLFKDDERFIKDGNMYCEDCFNDKFSVCEVCAETFYHDELNEDGVCEDCFQEELDKERNSGERKGKFKLSVKKKSRIYKSTSA